MPSDPLREKVKLYLKTLEKAKAGYDRADDILLEIAANWPESRKFVKIGKKKYEIIDNFAAKQKVWAHAAARPWSIEPVKKSKAA